MIDKKSKRFIAFLESMPGKRFMYLDGEEYPDELGDEDDFFSLARHAVSKGYAEFIRSQSGAHLGVQLSHVGRNWKEFRVLEAKERWKERAFGFFSGILVAALSEAIVMLLSK